MCLLCVLCEPADTDSLVVGGTIFNVGVVHTILTGRINHYGRGQHLWWCNIPGGGSTMTHGIMMELDATFRCNAFKAKVGKAT